MKPEEFIRIATLCEQQKLRQQKPKPPMIGDAAKTWAPYVPETAEEREHNLRMQQVIAASQANERKSVRDTLIVCAVIFVPLILALLGRH